MVKWWKTVKDDLCIGAFLRGAAIATFVCALCIGAVEFVDNVYAEGVVFQHAEVVSATQANTVVTFSDSVNGAFEAVLITIYNQGSDEIYVEFRSTTATTSSVPLRSGLTFTYSHPNGIAGIGIICASGESATVDVAAFRHVKP